MTQHYAVTYYDPHSAHFWVIVTDDPHLYEDDLGVHIVPLKETPGFATPLIEGLDLQSSGVDTAHRPTFTRLSKILQRGNLPMVALTHRFEQHERPPVLATIRHELQEAGYRTMTLK